MKKTPNRAEQTMFVALALVTSPVWVPVVLWQRWRDKRRKRMEGSRAR